MGLILLNKQPGITSFDALRDIKRALGTGKVGHTGTLDKFAQGLLIVLTGNALRLSQWFTGCDKKYTGRIKFGIETDTLDPEGNVIGEAALPSREQVENVLCKFTGEIKQAPPLYSAIHVNGQRASNLARAGKTPEMKERPVTVHELKLLSWEPPFADIFVHCSSGTYIRSLSRD
ncbi:MAG: tRNA pseudouridine(55) synthase TruB, partial [Treponema sp.]|nr:tRNA pseudouridine(55) synthase TruB [Treponema sp.]